MPYEKLFPVDEVYIMYNSKTGAISGPFKVIFNGELLRLRWSPINTQEQTPWNDRAVLATLEDYDTKVLSTPSGRIVLMEYLDGKTHEDYKENAKTTLKTLTSSIYDKMTEEKVPQDDKIYMLYKSETDSLSGSFRVILRGELLRFIWTPSDPNEQVTRNDFTMKGVPDILNERIYHTDAGTIVLLDYSKRKSKENYKEEARSNLDR